jgi:hypothetical protein
MAMQHGACAYRAVPKATDTNSQYAILIAVPLQHRLLERPSLLHLQVRCLSVPVCTDSKQIDFSVFEVARSGFIERVFQFSEQ